MILLQCFKYTADTKILCTIIEYPVEYMRIYALSVKRNIVDVYESGLYDVAWNISQNIANIN